MNSRRFLLVPAPREATLAPIYVAFLVLLCVTLLGFVVAIWPEESAHSAYRSEGQQAVSGGGSLQGGDAPAPTVPATPRPGTWM